MFVLCAVLLSQAALAAPQRTILAYGDSLMAGYQLRPGEGFAPQLEKALRARGHDVRVVGAGVSGDTSAQGRARVNWVLAGLKKQPDLVILELGANDMLRGQPPASAKANLSAMIKAFQGKGSRVLLAGMRASPNLGAPYVKAFDAMYPALAKVHGVPLYPFFLDGVAAVKGTQLADGMHPNPRGVTIMVARITPMVEKALTGMK
ncbi:arylesterase [Sandarakinorhabdus sp.]|uniref:arylesterase n=1 Tax=Sandarakinorhabdus sp. TaxID=1916663 RepID=UPI00286DFF41|nr:arylesterase [Sandarakinorhabdus sp.]